MKKLPPDVAPYKKTPTFSETTTPGALMKSHTTKAGTWGKIVVLEGALRYRILKPQLEQVELSPDRHGVVEPTIAHEVEPLGNVSFFVEFYK
jgi:tellurite resistance-related uncharacterized protein